MIARGIISFCNSAHFSSQDVYYIQRHPFVFGLPSRTESKREFTIRRVGKYRVEDHPVGQGFFFHIVLVAEENLERSANRRIDRILILLAHVDRDLLPDIPQNEVLVIFSEIRIVPIHFNRTLLARFYVKGPFVIPGGGYHIFGIMNAV